jgi:putative component of membrane protein insertase Oxa1/YidC/SpoIIIJ protein YidD
MTSPAAKIADRLIRGYQRHLSPRKSWHCAYGVAHGDTTCSAAVRRNIARRGVVRALRPNALQLIACYQAATMLAQSDVRGVCCCGGIPIPFRF